MYIVTFCIYHHLLVGMGSLLDTEQDQAVFAIPHVTSWFAGLLLWNQSRQHWVGNKKSDNRTHQVREPKLK